MEAQDRFQIRALFRQRLEGIYAWMYNATKQRRANANIYSSFSLEQLRNGLVRTSSLYYAIGRDIDTAEWVIYCSRAQKYLKSSKNDNGVRTFDDDEYRYHVITLPPHSVDQDFRDAIRDHHKAFNQYSFERARVHGGRLTKLLSLRRAFKKTFRGYIADEVFGWTNKDYALSVQQYGENDWRLKMSTPISHYLNLPRFTEIEGLRLRNSFWGHIFTSRRTVNSYKVPHHAMAFLDLINSQRSQRTWRGQNPTPMKESWVTNGSTKIYNFALDEVKSEETITESQFEGTVAFMSAVMSGAKVFGNLSGIRLVILAVVAGFGSRKGVGLFAKAKKLVQWYTPWTKGIESVDPTNGRHRANFFNNSNRHINAKPDLERKHRIHIYNGEELDISCDNEKQIDPSEKFWRERWITAYDSKAFSGRDSEIQSNISTDISYNGLVRLSYRCPETKKITTYAKYVRELDINPHISIPDEIKVLLAKNKIIKVEHENEKSSFTCEKATMGSMVKEIKPHIYANQRDITKEDRRIAERHIRWLFRDVSKDYEETDEAEIFGTEDDICASSWTGLEPEIERLKKSYGDDWEEMEQVTKENIRGLFVFNKNAVYPNVKPVIEEAKRNSPRRWFRAYKKRQTELALAA